MTESGSSPGEPPRPARRGGLRDKIYSFGETASVALTSTERPGRFARIFFKFPVWLQRLGLARSMGNSLVILTTVGRKTGRARLTALSNFGHDAATGTYYVVSGWGPRSDWYLNLKANPRVHVKVGRREFDGVAERVPEDLALSQLGEYLRLYPSVARAWAKRVGVSFDGSEASIRSLADHVVVVALRPKGKTA